MIVIIITKGKLQVLGNIQTGHHQMIIIIMGTRWSTENCSRNWDLTILPNGICTNKNPSWRMIRKKNSLGCWDTNGSANSDQKTRLSDYWKKRIWCIVDFDVLTVHKMKINENEKKEKYFDFAKELRKLWNMKVTDTNCNWRVWNGSHGLRRVGNRRTNRDHPNYTIAEIGQKTDKGPGDLLSLRLKREATS